LSDTYRGANKLRITFRKPYHRGYFYIAISAVIFLINQFILEPVLPDVKRFKSYKFPSLSMQPTLLVGDRLVVDRKIYNQEKPKRGDIVIFEYPKDPSKDFLKRVIGLEGEKVEITDNKLYINDKLIDDPWGYYDSSGSWRILDRQWFLKTLYLSWEITDTTVWIAESLVLWTWQR
jgi:signal peptidase I